MLDVRKPIGYLFAFIGAILVIYGVVQPQLTNLEIAATHEQLTFNLDLPWGAAMLLFGALMLLLAWLDARKATAPADSTGG
jgi:hypothetical protein